MNINDPAINAAQELINEVVFYLISKVKVPATTLSFEFFKEILESNGFRGVQIKVETDKFLPVVTHAERSGKLEAYIGQSI